MHVSGNFLNPNPLTQATKSPVGNVDPSLKTGRIAGSSHPDPDSKTVIVDSKAAAESFLQTSQQKLTVSLATVKRQFDSTIRRLAERARTERFESLRMAIKSLDEALQPHLQDEILIDM